MRFPGRPGGIECVIRLKNLNQEFSDLMPPKRTTLTRLKCLPVFTLIGVVLLVPSGVETQTGRVTLRATVSETVTLSVLPGFAHGHDAEVVSSGNTVRITSRSSNSEAPVISVPLLVRSNSGFKISAAVSEPASLIELSVTDVRATGRLVSPLALSGLDIPKQFDLDHSREVLLVSGPRVSLGGTLDSPNNALQITVLIRLQPQPAHGQLVHLTFAATAAPLTQ